MLRDDYPPSEKIAWFKREFDVTRSLDLPGVVDAYNLEHEQNRWVIALEDFGGESLTRLGVAGKLDPATFLRLAIDIVDNLGQIHQQRIMHKDINPSNIVSTPGFEQVKLIDFGISTVLSRENQTFRNPNVLEGTLGYISPEQTGRMNRAMDYRTDFYSLGVTFYELLTGQLPFESADPMELVHSHIARQPAPPHRLVPSVPSILSEIILKLMAKNAEDRYQSAHGIRTDLATCLSQLEATGQITLFPLGQQDTSDRFRIPQKLYGRSREIQTLLQAFDRVMDEEQTELLLVGGYSGVGKSALVQEIYKPITEKRGYFITGKYDQFQRNIPYYAITQAFNQFCHHLLTEQEEDLAQWQDNILQAVGHNARVLIDVVPDLALVIGDQPPVAQIGGQEAQNRFNLVFQNFVKAISQKTHPLVVFLDDLQWADAASLHLIQSLMNDEDNRYLLLIGAYRDNEVNSSHPFMLTVEGIRQTGRPIRTLEVENLSLPAVTELVGDTLYQPQVADLTGLIYEKTQGNAFFTTEFFKTLYEEDLIRFEVVDHGDNQLGQWRWDLEAIRSRELSDNVVELMTQKIGKLPLPTQRTLTLAACIGNSFDLRTLSVINQKPALETFERLWPAVTEGILVPLDDNYKWLMPDNDISEIICLKFAHDRVQQAAYALLAPNEKAPIHLQIGRLLLANTVPEELTERLFDIVNQLNLGRSRIDTEAEKIQLAELNLQAGQQAKSATAYQSAMDYLDTGIAQLTEASWRTHYPLTVALHKDKVEATYLAGNYEQADDLYPPLLAAVQTDLDKVAVCRLQMAQYQVQGRYLEALEVGRHSLRILNITVPDSDEAAQPQLIQELEQVPVSLGDRDIADLIHAPEATDVEHNMRMQLLAGIWVASYVTGQLALMSWSATKMTNLSLQEGHNAISASAYANYGVTACDVLGDYDTGYAFGELAVALSDRYDNLGIRGEVYGLFAWLIMQWKTHVKDTIPYTEKAFQYCLEGGNVAFAVYAAHFMIYLPFISGDNLQDIYQDRAHYVSFMRRMGPVNLEESLKPGVFQPLLQLLGQTHAITSLDNDDFNEATNLDTFKDVTLFMGWFYHSKIASLYRFEQVAAGLDIIDKADLVAVTLPSQVAVAEAFFFAALILLAVYEQANETEKAQLEERIERYRRQMRTWADHCEANFLHKYWLIEAEKARVNGQTEQAITLYDQAIQSARTYNYIQHEALGYELQAKFWLAKAKPDIAALYMRQAHTLYGVWGATAKMQQLEATYPHVLGQSETQVARGATVSSTQMSTATEISGTLDLASVLKASQVISGEIRLDTLLTKLMTIVIENAGAEKGYLLLETEGEWVVQAAGTVGVDEVTVLQAMPVVDTGLSPAEQDRHTGVSFPTTILNYVTRTQESVVVDDATQESQFTQDAYIQTHQPKSVLCAPLINQDRLSGVLYLENNLTTGAFTPDRIEVLNVLSSQAAISIENATLYKDLEASEKKYRTLFEDSRDVIFISTPDGRLVDVSPSVVQVLGYTREDALAMNTIDTYANPDDRLRFRREIEHYGAVKDFEVQFLRKDGRFMDGLVTATLRYAEDGTFLGYQGIIRDITEQKQNERLRTENLRLETELGIAQRLQEMLLPKQGELDQIEGIEIAAYMKPAAEVGGDYYDVLRHNDRVKIGIGDVTGHGLESGVVMLMVQMGIRTLLTSGETDPVRFLDILNRTIYDSVERLQAGKTLTLCLLDYSPVDGGGGQIRLSGQHEDVIVVRRDGTVMVVDTSDLGFPIGLVREVADFIDQTALRLQPGDGVVLYTDGITEAENSNGELYGLERLCALVKRHWAQPADVIKDMVVGDVQRHIGAQERYDDISLVVLKQK
jgi:PAS domain S-box-containing protein